MPKILRKKRSLNNPKNKAIINTLELLEITAKQRSDEITKGIVVRVDNIIINPKIKVKITCIYTTDLQLQKHQIVLKNLSNLLLLLSEKVRLDFFQWNQFFQ